jgi:NADPH:quinone reductase-like Zn-dependent oxidoreductase
VVREAIPAGLEAVFDGVGGDYIPGGFLLLRRGGSLVSDANPFNLARTLVQFGRILLLNVLPNGRSARHDSTCQSRLSTQPIHKDWTALLELLKAGRIEPVISEV